MSKFDDIILAKTTNHAPSIALSIIATHMCNYDCHYCYDTPNKDNIANNHKYIPKESVVAFVENYKRIVNKPLKINILGGEPTLHKYLDEIMDILRDNIVMEVRLTTNGSAKRELYDKLMTTIGSMLSLVYHTIQVIQKDMYIIKIYLFT